jgi:hypothetical protein
VLPGVIGCTMVEFGRVVFNGFVDALAGGRLTAFESTKFGFIGGIGMNGDIGAIVDEPELDDDEPELSEPEPDAPFGDVENGVGTCTVVPSVGKNIDVVPGAGTVGATPLGLSTTLPAAESTRPAESDDTAMAPAPDDPVALVVGVAEPVGLPPSPAVPAVVRLHAAMPTTTVATNIAEIVRLHSKIRM